jgi:predicted GTPase
LGDREYEDEVEEELERRDLVLVVALQLALVG